MEENVDILLKHARAELLLLEEEPEVIEYYIETVLSFLSLHGDRYTFFTGDFFTLLKLFADNCDYAPTEVVKTISDLLHLHVLSPLTNDPKEWKHHKDVVHADGLGIWQNQRDPTAFSNDGGLTYGLISEGHLTEYAAPVHQSKPSKKERHGS